MGTTIKCFHWDGKRPEERDRLKSICRGVEIEGAVDLSRNEETP